MASMNDLLYGLGKTAADKVRTPTNPKEGASGTTWRGPALILLTIHNMSILCAMIVSCAVFISLGFVVQPLMMAYFTTFLMAPIMDIFEKRPYDALGDSMGCLENATPCKTHYASDEFWQYDANTNEYFEKLAADIDKADMKWRRPDDDEIEKRRRMNTEDWNSAKDFAAIEGVQKVVQDFLVVGKVPHMVACALTLVLGFLIIFGSFMLVYSNFTAFLESEEAKAKVDPDAAISAQLTKMANGYVDQLENTTKVYRELVCPPKSLSNITVTAVKKAQGWRGDEAGFATFEFQHVQDFRTSWATKEYKEVADLESARTQHCYRKPIFGGDEGMLWEEFMGTLGSLFSLFNDTVLILLLSVYILLERPEGRTIGGDHACAMQIEDMINNYISLKFALSFLTGLLVAIVLVVCSVQMAVIFGFLSFALNFIPNVGSMIAIVLPIPIIIMDTNLRTCEEGFTGKSSECPYSWQVYAAVGIPMLIQGYVGNALEPMLFGAALNLTAISVLLSLVVFAYLWGMIGAVLSVPLLGGAKIVLYNTDHPIALGMLALVREDENLP